MNETYLVPLDDGFGVPDDGAEELDGVALLSHVAVEIVGRRFGGTCKRTKRKAIPTVSVSLLGAPARNARNASI